MWWDEFVQVRTAAAPTFVETWRKARSGIPPGSGNAGAMPLDYLLLHGWMTVAPRPEVGAIEGYFRFPSLLCSTAAVIALFVYAVRCFDLSTALLAGGLLATSIPHIVYAAEARPYSLLSLTAVLLLSAFSAVVAHRSARAWLVYTASAGLAFLSGIPSLLLLAVQYAVLLATIARESLRSRRFAPLVALVASAATIAAAVLWYYHGSAAFSSSYGRRRELHLPTLTLDALMAFAQGSRVLLVLFLAALPITLVRGRRRGPTQLAIAAALVTSFLTIPAMIEVARWKEYYFHTRHVLLLLPLFALVTAIGLRSALAWVAERLLSATFTPRACELAATIAGVVTIVVLQGPSLRNYFIRPEPAFGLSKTQRDFSGLMDLLRARTSRLHAGEPYLLIAEGRLPGRIGNPLLAKYLQWHGLAEKVVLRGSEDPDDTLRTIARLCPRGCAGEQVTEVETKLRVGDPLGIRKEFRALLALAPAAPPAGARIGALGVLYYDRVGGGIPRSAAFTLTRRHGLALLEKRPGPALAGAPGPFATPGAP